MFMAGNTRKTPTQLSAFAYLGGEKRPRSGKVTYWQMCSVRYQLLTASGNSKRINFFERTIHESL
jgi:hypothetical protein